MNIPGKIVLSVLTVAGLVGLSLWLVPQWFSSSPGLYDYGHAPVSLSVTEVTQTRHADVAGTGGCDARLLYPQIADSESSTIPSETREKINVVIQKQVQDFFAEGSANLDEAATDFVTTCEKDLTDLTVAMNDPIASAQEAWVSEIGYDIKLNDGKYLSLGIANYLSTGGAHPNTTELFLTFDFATGNIVTLRDLLVADKILPFEIQEKQWLVDNAKDQLFEESTIEFESFIATPTQAQAEAYVDNAIFYVTEKYFVTFYNPYTIAPYASGPIEVMIPRT
ncbi:MAG: DUF3298 domain-containing protein [Patescibacteria group bacterium]|jgi:hypothetical protein